MVALEEDGRRGIGPLVLSGLAIFGAIVGIGRLATAPPPNRATVRPVPASRSLAIIFLAFIEGHGVVGVVVGILAIVGGIEVDPSTAPVVVILALLGAVIAVLPMIRDGSDLDPWIVTKAIPFMGGLIVLAIVLVILASVIQETGSGTPPAWAFPILGLISAAASISLGVLGRRSIEAAARAEDSDVAAIRARAISTVVPLQTIAVIALAIGIILVSTAH
jgi:hypothetical protein